MRGSGKSQDRKQGTAKRGKCGGNGGSLESSGILEVKVPAHRKRKWNACSLCCEMK